MEEMEWDDDREAEMEAEIEEITRQEAYEEEEGIRAKDKMNAILIRMSKSALVKGL